MEIIKNIAYFFIASGILAWLIRSLVKLYLDKDIEKYKTELKKELETHKKLHSERMFVIKEGSCPANNDIIVGKAYEI